MPKTPESREQLIKLLKLAAELEHQLLCAYLITAYTVKQDETEFSTGLSDSQREFMFEDGRGVFGNGPRIVLIEVAVQEMLHLALVSNLLAAVSCEPRDDIPFFARQNFPLTPKYMRERFGYNQPGKNECDNAWIGVWEFNLESMRGWEWFENFDETTFDGPVYSGESTCDATDAKSFIDDDMEISTLVELYQAIARAFVELGDKEKLDDGHPLFCGNRERQIETPADDETAGKFHPEPVPDVLKVPEEARQELSGFPFEWALMQEITDVTGAIDAINVIVVQGEASEEDADEEDDWDVFIEEIWGRPPSELPSHKWLENADQESHFVRFQQVRSKLAIELNEDPKFSPGRKIHIFDNLNENSSDEEKLGFELAELFDDLYSLFVAMLYAAFRHPIPEASAASTDELITARYERITLAQTSMAIMLYMLSPLGNALPQVFSGVKGAGGQKLNIAPRFNYHRRDSDWDSLVVQFDHLAERALGLVDRLPDNEVWMQPNYTALKESGEIWPKLPLKVLVKEFVGLNARFVSQRLKNVKGNRPIRNSSGDLHSCMGLNECRGLDITGTAVRAGEGTCATAMPHTCASLNACNHQSMCGFDDQTVPGANKGAGSGGCNSPALPSARNTDQPNTPNGSSQIYAKAKGNVWRFARILFEERMDKAGIAYGPSRGPGGVGEDEFPGSDSSQTEVV